MSSSASPSSSFTHALNYSYANPLHQSSHFSSSLSSTTHQPSSNLNMPTLSSSMVAATHDAAFHIEQSLLEKDEESISLLSSLLFQVRSLVSQNNEKTQELNIKTMEYQESLHQCQQLETLLCEFNNNEESLHAKYSKELHEKNVEIINLNNRLQEFINNENNVKKMYEYGKNEIENEKKYYEEKYTTLLQDYETTVGELNTAQSSLTAQQAALLSAETQAKNYKTELEILSDAYRVCCEDKNHYSSLLQSNTEEFQHKIAQLQALHMENQGLEATINELKLELSRIESHHSSTIQSLNQRLHSLHLDKDQHSVMINDISSQNDTLKLNINKFKLTIEQLENNLNLSKNENYDLTNKINCINNKCNHYESIINNNKNEIQNLKSNNSELISVNAAQLNKLNQIMSQVDDLQVEKSNLNLQIHVLMDRVQDEKHLREEACQNRLELLKRRTNAMNDLQSILASSSSSSMMSHHHPSSTLASHSHHHHHPYYPAHPHYYPSSYLSSSLPLSVHSSLSHPYLTKEDITVHPPVPQTTPQPMPQLKHSVTDRLQQRWKM